jgi:hypothetical protein
LKPVGVFLSLLGGEYLDKSLGEAGKLVCARDVTVEGCRVELGEDVDFDYFRVDAVADRNIDEAIFACEGNSGFGSQFG